MKCVAAFGDALSFGNCGYGGRTEPGGFRVNGWYVRVVRGKCRHACSPISRGSKIPLIQQRSWTGPGEFDESIEARRRRSCILWRLLLVTGRVTNYRLGEKRRS